MTVAIQERYVVDEQGKQVGVLLDIGDYRRILDELEELEVISVTGGMSTAELIRDKPVRLGTGGGDCIPAF